MQISKFRELEKKINDNDFNSGYKNINMVMKLLSYFGNIASIFLAYFFMSKIISSGISNSIAVFISSVIILSGIELLKRDIFNKFSVQYLKDNRFTKNILALAFASLFLIGSSFYLSINGAHDFSNKTNDIELSMESTLNEYTDSLTKIYDKDLLNKQKEIDLIKKKIEDKDGEQTQIESLQPLNKQQRLRVADLKTEKNQLRLDKVAIDSSLSKIKYDLNNKIDLKKKELLVKTGNKKDDSSSNSFIFVIISTLVEFSILIGIFFNEYYIFRSYKEYREKLNKDPNYQKWLLYDTILNLIMTDDTKINQKLLSNKAIIDLCKVNDLIVLKKDVVSFIQILVSLNIIKSSGSVKYINRTKESSIEALRSHFNIK